MDSKSNLLLHAKVSTKKGQHHFKSIPSRASLVEEKQQSLCMGFGEDLTWKNTFCSGHLKGVEKVEVGQGNLTKQTMELAGVLYEERK